MTMPDTESRSGGTDRCDRRDCEKTSEYRLFTESTILHEPPTEWTLCDEHVHVAIEEWRGSINVLTSRENQPDPETEQAKLVTDGGESPAHSITDTDHPDGDDP
jgi:hypothetical protein